MNLGKEHREIWTEVEHVHPSYYIIVVSVCKICRLNVLLIICDGRQAALGGSTYPPAVELCTKYDLLTCVQLFLVLHVT